MCSYDEDIPVSTPKERQPLNLAHSDSTLHTAEGVKAEETAAAGTVNSWSGEQGYTVID